MPTKKNQVYRCEICGNIVEVLHEAGGTLVCCGQNMNLQEENTTDASKEKHIPIVEGNKVKVGSIEHPMEEEHYIEWIEATSENGEVSKIFLNPGDKPEVEFTFHVKSVRAYCNLHRLWMSE